MSSEPHRRQKEISRWRRTVNYLTKELRTLLTKSPNVLSFENKTGQALYDDLDDIRRAGVLNIARKTLATRLSNEKSVCR